MSTPVNNNRLAIERVLEKTLEDTHRDLAAFLKARGDRPTFDPHEEGRRERGEPGDADRGSGDRSNRSGEQGFGEPQQRQPRLVAETPAREAGRAPRPDLQAPRPPRPAAPLVAPQAFLTPGHLVPPAANEPVASAIPPAVSSLMQAEAERLRGAPPVAPRPEPSLAERVITERRPPSDWPPVAPLPPAAALAPPSAPPAMMGPRLSALVPRKVQDRIDEFYRTGSLSEEPFHFEPVEPMPGALRPAPILRSGLPPADFIEGPRAVPVEGLGASA